MKWLALYFLMLLSLLMGNAAAQVTPSVTSAAVDTTGLRSRPASHQEAFFSCASDLFTDYQPLDAPPLFKGGEAALRRFLSRNLRFPPALLRAHVEGSTGVRFIVDADGRICNSVVYKSLCEPWDDEVLRIVKLLDYKFEPATYNGRRVSAPYSLVVPFSIK